MEMKFYQCAHCGQTVAIVKKTGVPVICCGEPMKELVPGATDGAMEKHVPAVTVEGNKVKVVVGEVEHPMADAHYITFIAINTKNGGDIKRLSPGEKPAAEFTLEDGDEFISAIEYCNLHGLWEGK